MGTFNTWEAATINALQNTWVHMLNFIPKLLGAVVILLIGLFIASFLQKLVIKLLKWIKFDNLVESTRINENLQKIGLNKTVTKIIGVVVKWFFIIVTLTAVVDVLDISQLSNLLNQVILYLPNVLVAILILILGLMGGQVVHKIITKSIQTSKVSDATSQVISSGAKWTVVILAFMAALVQLKIAEDMIKILFTGIVAMLALAGGLAFGLGGRDRVRAWIDTVKW
ncbi:MAG: hypothetical protein U5L10_05485 [Candidatus Moranbacteria bacterium]|nr:hypothetical protein [Candidatus Moranbacteria bacterium]